MIKRLFIVIFLMPVIACTSQVTRHNVVLFENSCAEELTVEAENRSNFDLSPYQTPLAPRKQAVVASYMAYTESVTDQVQSDYKLRVFFGRGKVLSLGRDELIERLSGMKPVVKGNSHIWIFSDSSLCSE
ncbi:hypothetical protein [Ectopseudomonas guguanensis]|jgi:hypothetical protein|uniref:hypothetical protein n=1 Tax=Ectopseudomonas guguanensis TaxID=1198456 RepID=UPI001114507E|nr:hypothetical protein [Pseudomonas guguanensis]